MHQKTPYKFNAGNGQFLPLSFFPVILNRKSNIFIIHMDDAVIADSDPMGILSKVINHRLCTVKSFLTVRNPFCVVTGIYKFFEFIMITVFFCCSMKLKLICIPEIFQFIHIFPTKYFGDSPYREKKLRTIIVFAQLERETIQKRVTDAYYSRCLKGFHMSGQAPYGYQLEPTVVEGIRTKKMVADPVAADHVRLMFEMYAEPETSFGDITRYFEEHDIKIYGKSMFRTFLSQLLRNPVYAQADLELYEFFKSQGAAIVNDASDFAGTNGCYLYQGRDVKEDKDRCLKDQILVIAPHEALISSDTWLKCRKKLMANTTFQQGRKPKNTWLAGKIKCGHCGYALKATHVPNSTGYFRCTKRTENKGCPGCGKIRKEEFEQFIFSAMQEKFKDFQILHGREEKVNPKLTAYQVELAQVEAEIEKLLDTLTGANATLLAYANKKIEELDTRRQTISKAIAELSVETISPQQIKKLSYYLDNWESIDFDDKRKAADGLISTIKATSDRVQIEWKI